MLKDPYGKKRAAPSQAELNAILQAHERYVAHQGGLRAQLANTTLDGLNLANRNLEDADFAGASLVGASLYGSNLYRASLYCADLSDCDLRYTKLVRADMRGASFKGAKLGFSVMDNADLRSGRMVYVGSDGAIPAERNKPGGDEPPGARGVDFSNCSMKGVSFGNAKLDGANFTGALLHGATFRNANIVNSVFSGAVLTGVNLADLHLPPEALAGCVRDVSAEAAAKSDALKARLDSHERWVISEGREGEPAMLDGEDLRPLREVLAGRRLAGLSARNTVAIEIDFSAGEFQAAKFDGADLRGANFSKADLRGASFKRAKMAHAHLEGANLRALQLADGSMLKADLAGAEIAEEQMRKAIHDETT